MSIHSEIKRLRLLKGWSQTDLAAAVSKVEGKDPPLSWQTVQQWEREPTSSQTKKSTAPTRERLKIVAALLDTTPAALLSGHKADELQASNLSGSEGMLVAYFRLLDSQDQQRLLVEAREKAASYSVTVSKRRDAA